jgi:hypothetical protein
MSFFRAVRNRSVSALALLTAIAGALLAVPAVASAEPYPPSAGCTLSSSNTGVTGGEQLTVTGSGFPAGASVALSISSSGASLGTVTTNSSGTFTDTVTVPASATSTDRIVAASSSTTCSFDPFGSGATASGSSSASSSTANTGFRTLTASLIAVALLGGGVLLVLLGRRRRQN